MTLLAPWILFPAVLTLLSLGCGLLLEQICGQRISGPLLPAAGLATIIVAGEAATAMDATAELTTPLVLGLAIAGVALSIPWGRGRPNPWEAAAGAGAFAVFAAPVVLSGKATFAGYIKLDDTATWMALTDWVIQHGPHVHGLAISSYEATLGVNLTAGYPYGTFLPLGAASAIAGQDVAWTIQPYMALVAGMLALALTAIARPLVRSAWLRSLAAFIAAQSALLFGYSLWGGVKELVGAVLLVTAAAVVPTAVRPDGGIRATVPLAVAASAILAVFGVGGAVWLVPLLLPALFVAMRFLGTRAGAVRAAAFAVLAVLLTLPMLLAAGSVFSPTQGPLVNNTELGNLLGPLNALQVFGIWPVGDFRVDPGSIGFTYLLIAISAVTAIFCLRRARLTGAWSLLLYVAGVTAGCFAIVVVASPWVDAKALASASPAVLFAATAGAAALIGGGQRIAGAIALVAIAAGVVTSNVLAYRQVNLAPRGELGELETIGHRIDGQGPTLIAADLIYGARHFLRDADPEAPSELRVRPITLRDGTPADKPLIGGTDAIQLPSLMVYRTIVIPRSPVASRPPLPYSLTFAGRYFTVWQRPVGTEGSVLDHLPLGGEFDAVAVPKCADVLSLARRAPRGSRLAAARPVPATVAPLTSRSVFPVDWINPAFPKMLVPRGAGSVVLKVRVRTPGPKELWLGGSVRAGLAVSVDGVSVGSVRHRLTSGGYIPLGQIELDRGVHQVVLRYSGADWHPGSANSAALAYPIGPLALSPPVDDPGVTYVDRSRARDLCGRPWDWIEAVAG